MKLEATQSHISKNEVLNKYWGLVEKTIDRFADKDFIVTKNGNLTYGEANRQANLVYDALARHNFSTGIGIGLFIKDTLKIVPSMIGTLKANHYFVPLDVTFPTVTLKKMIEVAKVKVIIVEREYLSRVKSLVGLNIVVINYDDFDQTIQIPNPVVKYAPDDWVQILFTSGSTGEQKGVIETYRYLAHAAYIKCTASHLDSSDRVLQLSDFTFSGHHTLVFGALLIGMTLCYYRVKEDGFVGLADWMHQEWITYYKSVATVFRSLVSALGPEDQFPAVREAHVGGEKLFHHDIETCKKIFPNLQHIHIGFASTETQSIASSNFSVAHDFGVGDLPAGTPNKGITVLIWDEDGDELPVGEEGEIVAYSDTLARGYINNPELTKERFIPDPQNPIFQYYKTGDLGKLLPDGQVVVLGRLDNMVKLKGVRIELSSIESHIMTYPGINQVACIVFEDRKGNQKLAAYFTAEAGIEIPVSDLRVFLTERLPTHLLPHYFIRVKEFPSTHSGKLARTQLPPPILTRPELGNPYTPPANDLEATLVKIWEEEIGIEGIGVTDDFFEVGGDSLIGVLLFIRIEQVFGRVLPVSTLMLASTIRKQAEIIGDQDTSQDFAPMIAIKSQGKGAPLFFFPGKGGYPTRTRFLAKVIDPGTPVYAFQDLPERRDFKPFRTVESKAIFYINEIKKVVPHGPYILVGESGGGLIAYEAARQLDKTGEEVPILALLDTYNMNVSIKEEGWDYYRMLFKKHLKIIRSSDWSDRWDYLKFYRETFIEKLSSHINERFEHSRGRKTSVLAKNAKQIERANIASIKKYHPGRYPGRVILFKAIRGPEASHPTNGWDGVEIRELVIHTLDCYHGSILFEPAVSKMVELLNTYISESAKFSNRL